MESKSSVIKVDTGASKADGGVEQIEDELGEILIGSGDSSYNMTNHLAKTADADSESGAYYLRSTLGEGAFGSVRRAVKTMPDGRKQAYAVKIFNHNALKKKNVSVDSKTHKRVVKVSERTAPTGIPVV